MNLESLTLIFLARPARNLNRRTLALARTRSPRARPVLASVPPPAPLPWPERLTARKGLGHRTRASTPTTPASLIHPCTSTPA